MVLHPVVKLQLTFGRPKLKRVILWVPNAIHIGRTAFIAECQYDGTFLGLLFPRLPFLRLQGLVIGGEYLPHQVDRFAFEVVQVLDVVVREIVPPTITTVKVQVSKLTRRACPRDGCFTRFGLNFVFANPTSLNPNRVKPHLSA